MKLLLHALDGRRLAALAALCLCACAGRLSASGGSSDQGGGAPDGPPIAGGGAEHPAYGLISAVPSADALRIDWRAIAPGATPPSIAIFVGTDRQALFDGPPVAVDPPGSAFVASGLAGGVEHYAGLAVFDGTGFVRQGPVLTATTGPPIYADPEADPSVADGLLPETAFADVFPAVLTAFAQGGGNVWVRGGTFSNVSLPLFEGVDLYGGFGPGFDLLQRDPARSPTSFLGQPGQSIVALQSGTRVAVVDGLSLEGLSLSSNGVDLDDAPAELRGISVRGCSRGVKLRAPDVGDPVAVTIVHSSFTENDVGGMSVDGAFDLLVEDCRFDSNQQEGVDMDDWVAPDGDNASLVVRDCVFADNGADGLDVDLGLPFLPGAVGATFRVRIEDCEFLNNGESGLLLDIDYEQAPLWSADIRVRGCVARGNQENGILLDLDGNATVFVHRTAASANRGDGLRINSESAPGTVTVSTSAFVGNRESGVRSSNGNFGVVLSHCVIAGNFAGGVRADVVGAAVVSTVSYLQPNPWQGARRHFALDVADALSLPFQNVPFEYLRVTGASSGTLTLAEAPSFGVGALCEVVDDAVARSAVQVGALSVGLDPVPQGLTFPTLLAYFANGVDVHEDYRLTVASPAGGAGMTPPFGMPVDAGIFGAPLAGDPGGEALVPPSLFYVADTSPEWVQPIAAMQAIEVRLKGGEPDPVTVPGSVFVVDDTGATVAANAFVSGGHVIVEPPPMGWTDGSWLELHAELASTDGHSLAAPVALPIDVE